MHGAVQGTNLFIYPINDRGMSGASGEGRLPEWTSDDTALLDSSNRLGTCIPKGENNMKWLSLKGIVCEFISSVVHKTSYDQIFVSHPITIL